MAIKRIRMITRLDELAPEQWDRVANPDDAPFDPFLSWDFLDALERSGSAVEETGWGPRHLIAEDEAGAVTGALPLYLKGHSQGEYVFDHAWADAFERGGGRYYPKLVTAIPFTPVTGRRVLAGAPQIRAALIDAARHVADEWNVSSWHVLFPETAQRAEMEAASLLARCDVQYVWENNGYAAYEDFLADLSSRKRKALKKERAAAGDGLEIVRLTGAQITEEHWDVFFECYQDTGARKWGHPYLNRAFFTLIGERMAGRILMVMARREGRWIAAALNFIGSDALYGRYWGCLEERDSLHFELCYHQAVEFAIERGLARVEAGAQGHHKLARGYRPRPVWSAHHLSSGNFKRAVKDYLDREREAVTGEIAAMEAESPFRKTT